MTRTIMLLKSYKCTSFLIAYYFLLFIFTFCTVNSKFKSSSFTFMTRLHHVRCSMAASNVHGEEGRRPASPQRLWGILFPPSHPRLLFLSVDVVLRPGKNAHVRQTCLFLVFLFYCVLLWQRGRADSTQLTAVCLWYLFTGGKTNKKTRVL